MPFRPQVNWKKPLPRKPNEDEQRAIESLYVTNPVTGEKLLDYRQLNYRYEIYDYTTAALRKTASCHKKETSIPTALSTPMKR